MATNPFVAFRCIRATRAGEDRLFIQHVHSQVAAAGDGEYCSSVFRMPTSEAVWRNPGTGRDSAPFNERGEWQTDDKWVVSVTLKDLQETAGRRLSAVWAANSGAAIATLLAAMDAELDQAGWI